MGTYTWPRGPSVSRPYASQIDTARFLVKNKRAFCFSEMGCGKTLATLWAADYLMDRAARSGARVRCLVLAPISTMRTVWETAIWEHFLGKRTIGVLCGPAERRLATLRADHDFYIANHDVLSMGADWSRTGRFAPGPVVDMIGRMHELSIIIIDEVSAFRNPQSLRSRCARRAFDGKEHVWALTGTPTPQGPLDAYGLARLLNIDCGSRRSWRDRTMRQISTWRWEPRSESTRLTHELLQPAIRYELKDVAELPPLIYMPVHVAELTRAQEGMLNNLRKEFSLQMSSGAIISVANEAAMRTKMIQVACGAVYDEKRTVHTIDSLPRLETLSDLMASCTRKIIVLAPLTSVVCLLYTFISQSGYECAKVTGSTTLGERTSVFTTFQNAESELRVIVADPGVLSHGLDLTRAADIIWYAPIDRAEQYTQACRRIHRPGQTETTRVMHIASTRLETLMYERLQSKQAMQGVLLRMLKEGADACRRSDDGKIMC